MDFFYIRHHFQSVFRSVTFKGQIFALITLGIVFSSSVVFLHSKLDEYAHVLSRAFGKNEPDYSLFLLAYLFVDLAVRLVFRRPFPKLKYYMLWMSQSKTIAWQYMITSLFGIVPFLLLMTLLMTASKANEWLGEMPMVAVIVWWLINHFIALGSQFAVGWVKNTVASIVLLILVSIFLFPGWLVPSFLLTPFVVAILLIAALIFAFLHVKRMIEKRVVENPKGLNYLDSLPVVSFKNPIFQLEWALLVRNKRTRSNLLMGMISVLILPLMIDTDSQITISSLIFLIVTGFFIIQHGSYSLGWEGSYFDFLITNISPKAFMKTRYVFYVGTCLLGLLLATIPVLIKGLNWVDLLMAFLFNAGVTVPLVLYRSVFNDTKIVLTENSFMNYNGMMTGPIFVTSFLIMIFPLGLIGVGVLFIGSNAFFLLGVCGIVGLLAFKPITRLLAERYQQKKYHLTQSFKA